jgi:hypothetical protein
MKKYEAGGDIDYKTPEDVAELKKMLAAKKAYDQAMPEPDTTFRGSMLDSLMGSKPKKDPRDAVRGQRGYASGGKVSSASSRADGCATKGKTKGTMITMYGGGKC